MADYDDFSSRNGLNSEHLSWAEIQPGRGLQPTIITHAIICPALSLSRIVQFALYKSSHCIVPIARKVI